MILYGHKDGTDSYGLFSLMVHQGIERWTRIAKKLKTFITMGNIQTFLPVKGKNQAINVYVLSWVTVRFLPHHFSHINKRLSVNQCLASVSEARGTSQRG